MMTIRQAREILLLSSPSNSLKGGTISGSINLPAQSLWPSIPALYNIFKAAGVRRVIWYCGK